jgi:hypothetical protein
MPRYFFHARMKAGPIVRDGVGIEFRNLAAAKADAQEAVKQTIVEKNAAGEPIEIEALEIADRRGRTLAVVSFLDSDKPTRQ